jgi:hypothetical protein
LITTEYDGHSPEIAYMEKNINGLITPFTIEHYTETVLDLMNNSEKLNGLKQGCKKAALQYTIENMAQRFADGIKQCLLSN